MLRFHSANSIHVFNACTFPVYTFWVCRVTSRPRPVQVWVQMALSSAFAIHNIDKNRFEFQGFKLGRWHSGEFIEILFLADMSAALDSASPLTHAHFSPKVLERIFHTKPLTEEDLGK